MAILGSLLESPLPPWLLRFVKQTGRGINRFSMIRENENILLGISGGKDSLALALALSLRKRWLPISYNLSACLIHWLEYPLREDELSALKEYFSELEIPLNIINTKMYNDSFKGNFNCYLCSRNRKRILFQEAERLGINKIALGHHLDDIIETTLIYLCFRGNISTMLPVQSFFKGKMFILRPLCEVKESTVNQVTERLHLPVSRNQCPFRDTNIRAKIKPVIRELVHLNKQAREHIYNAPYNVISEYLPSACNRIVSGIDL